jgi:hypothetical protein
METIFSFPSVFSAPLRFEFPAPQDATVKVLCVYFNTIQHKMQLIRVGKMT